MNLRKQLSSYIALNNYVEAIRGLPAGYTELEYIKGDGDAYINLGISLTQKDSIEIDFIANYTTSAQIFGYRNSPSEQNIALFTGGGSNTIYSDFNNSEYTPYRLSSTTVDNTVYKVKLNKNKRQFYDANGTLITENTAVCPDTITTGDVYLFYVNGVPAQPNKFTGSIKKVVISNRMYLIPAKNSFGTIGMYDTISGTFFTNSNTGSFVAGPEVSTSSVVLTDAIRNGLTGLQLKGSEVKNQPETFLNSVVAKGKTELRLPIERYDVLEYLESTGTQYIDTGFVVNSDTYIKTEFVIKNDISANGAIFGARPTGGIGTGSQLGHGVDAKIVMDWLSGTRFTSSEIFQKNIPYVAEVSNRVFTIKNANTGTIITTNTFADGVSVDCNFALLGLNNGGTFIPSPDFIQLKSFIIKNSDNALIHNFVPVRRKSDGVLGIYDKVSGEFLINQGTGDFIAGAIIDTISVYLPEEYTMLDYIQSSGSQYIDIGRVPNNNDIIEQKFQKIGTSTATCAWYGSMPSSTTILPRISIGSFLQVSVPTLFAGVNHTGALGSADTNVHTLRFQATGTKELTYTLDGVTSVIVATETINMLEPAVELTSYLFARHGTNGVQVYDNEGTKIYYHREYLANGTLVLNMVPVKRNSDNVLGMYDSVTETFFTNQGTGSFIAGPEMVPIPTPDKPVDIWCNNGGLKVRHQSGLPLGYTLLDYIHKTNTTHFNTLINQKEGIGVKVTARFSTYDDNYQYVLGAYHSGDYIGVWKENASNLCLCYKSSIKKIAITDTSDFHTMTINYLNSKTFTVDGVSQGDITETKSASSPTLYIGDTNYSQTFSSTFDIKDVEITDGTTVVAHYIPVKRNSDSVIGLYDIISDVFLLSSNSANISAGSPVNDLEVYTDGTIETLQDSTGLTAEVQNLLGTSNYQDIQSILDGAITRNVGVKVLDGNEEWSVVSNNRGYWFPIGVLQETYTNVIGVCSHFDFYIWDDNTVSMPVNKFGFNKNSGTGKTNGNVTFRPDLTIYSSVDIWKQYLADQYVNGTPVIIIYPLAESTTETVSSQRLLKNPVIITEASIDNLEVTTTETEHTVPTLDYPLDIVCNNGILKLSPNLFNADSSNVKVGYWINNNTGEEQSNNSNFLINGYISVKPNTSYVAYGKRKTDNYLSKWNRIAWYDSDKNYISTSPYTQDTIGLGTSPSNAAYARFSSNPTASTVTQDTVDSFNWTFREGTQEYTEFIPYNDVIVEGTPETVTITGKNLYDVTEDVNGKYIDTNGNIGDESRSCYCDLIPVKPGETYTYSGICKSSSGTSNNKRIHGYIDGIWNQQIKTVTVTINMPFSDTFVIPANINGIRISHWYEDENTQVEESSRPTKYEEYYQESFAPEDLLKLGDYQDVQDVINGIKSKNINVKVLDGSEDWVYSSSWSDTTHKCFYITPFTGIKQQTTSDNNCLCSHFEWYSRDDMYNDKTIIGGCVSGYTPTNPESGKVLTIRISSSIAESVTDFKQWLADQYAAGTPVIIVYPLADTVEETVESRNVFITSGTNIIERNSEYVSSDDITVGYKKLR